MVDADKSPSDDEAFSDLAFEDFTLANVRVSRRFLGRLRLPTRVQELLFRGVPLDPGFRESEQDRLMASAVGYASSVGTALAVEVAGANDQVSRCPGGFFNHR